MKELKVSKNKIRLELNETELRAICIGLDSLKAQFAGKKLIGSTLKEIEPLSKQFREISNRILVPAGEEWNNS